MAANSGLHNIQGLRSRMRLRTNQANALLSMMAARHVHTLGEKDGIRRESVTIRCIQKEFCVLIRCYGWARKFVIRWSYCLHDTEHGLVGDLCKHIYKTF